MQNPQPQLPFVAYLMTPRENNTWIWIIVTLIMTEIPHIWQLFPTCFPEWAYCRSILIIKLLRLQPRQMTSKESLILFIHYIYFISGYKFQNTWHSVQRIFWLRPRLDLRRNRILKFTKQSLYSKFNNSLLENEELANFKLTPQQTEGMWLSLCDSDHDPAFVVVTYIVICVLLVWIKIMSGYNFKFVLFLF